MFLSKSKLMRSNFLLLIMLTVFLRSISQIVPTSQVEKIGLYDVTLLLGFPGFDAIIIFNSFQYVVVEHNEA